MRLGFILVAAFAGMTVADDCFGDPYKMGSPKWDDEKSQKVIEKLILTKCEDGTFDGRYEEGKQSRSKSYTITNLGNRQVHIEIEHIKGGGRDLPDYECKCGLIKELKNCAYGGATKYRNWSYRAQPYDETMYEASWYSEPSETITVNV
ncbi:hypothetical protein F4809DRAFT_645490 [Biscogniauxia mediterranea]|nr:hypothetical protein F4809DRAFT_645490 [Biscogniauxia mediterranea]